MSYVKKIKFETKIMTINIFLLLIMSLSSIILGNLSHSEAIKFDGLFSFIVLITVIIGIVISNVTIKKSSDKYPHGKYQLTNIFVLLKIYTLLFLVLYSLISSLSSLYSYYVLNVSKEEIIFGYTYIYYFLMFFVKGASILLYIYAEKKYKNSLLLKGEKLSSITDELLTLSIFIGLNFFTYIPFLKDTADDVILLIISIYLIVSLSKELVVIINNIIGKRTLINKEKEILNTLKENVLNVEFDNCYIETIGENYEIIILCKTSDNIRNKTQEINKIINGNYNESIIEILWGEL